jgi:hypothetical protein
LSNQAIFDALQAQDADIRVDEADPDLLGRCSGAAECRVSLVVHLTVYKS